MPFEPVEYQFPDESKQEDKQDKVEETSDELEIEIVDDTPPEDRGRKPGPPPEEVSDEELTKYSEDVQKRIKKFTKGYHDERRAKEAALREKEEAIRLAQAIIEENKKLKGSLGQSQSVLVEQAKKVASTDVEEAKRKLRAAHEAFDTDAIIEAQEQLTVAKMRAERIERMPLQQERNEVQTQQPAPIQPDTRAVEWQNENPWFGSDDEMTAFALGLHQKLVKQGIDPKSDTYYEKINSRMRQVFPDQFEEDEPEEKPKPKAKANVVAPATRSTAPKKIVLTASQQALAKRLGVPLEIYAKQVAEEMRKQNG
jgi:hypothetical protein